MTKALIGTREAATLLNVSLPTATRMAQEGELPVVGKLPGRTGAYLFDRAAVEALAAERAA